MIRILDTQFRRIQVNPIETASNENSNTISSSQQTLIHVIIDEPLHNVAEQETLEEQFAAEI